VDACAVEPQRRLFGVFVAITNACLHSTAIRRVVFTQTLSDAEWLTRTLETARGSILEEFCEGAANRFTIHCWLRLAITISSHDTVSETGRWRNWYAFYIKILWRNAYNCVSFVKVLITLAFTSLRCYIQTWNYDERCVLVSSLTYIYNQQLL